ncbi:MAG: magnesium/cobalt transporter CorA [Bacillota bacterium]
MIRILAVTQDLNLLYDPPLAELNHTDIKWYWMDFDSPSEEESALLDHFFHFHHLAIEDCLHFLQRPKLEYYDLYNFFIINALDINTLKTLEIDIFVGARYIVSYHKEKSPEIDIAWQQFIDNEKYHDAGPVQVAYLIMDKIVDEYFPAVYQIEDKIDELENEENGYSVKYLLNRVFDIRGDLLKLRRAVNSMEELLYRILNSSHLEGFKERQIYFRDIHDHLLKLSEMIESNLDITADLRDSYLAINANRMNSIMMVLTIISSIFIPLTFIAGIYGMNFDYMPELRWKYGYFFILGIMGAIALMMVYWFKRKGWFDIDK